MSVGGAQSVGRAIALLRRVAALPHGRATLPALVHDTGLNRSTAFRLLRFLVEERMLGFDEVQRSYHIGPLAVELGLAGGGMAALSAAWSDLVRRISVRSGLTTYLVARSGSESVCLEAEEAKTALRAVPLSPGQRLPLGIGAGSLAILASLDDAEIDRILKANGEHLPLGAKKRVARESMWERVEQTRARGYAYSQQTVVEGIVGIGLLLPRQDELVLRAISVSKVGQSLSDSEQSELVELVRQELVRPDAAPLQPQPAWVWAGIGS